MKKIDKNSMVFYPLTHPQKRIWYIEKINPGTSLYNVGGYTRIKGKVDLDILEESINIFINKNDGIRLRLVEQSGDVKQYISSYERVKLDFFDFSQYLDPEIEFEKWVKRQALKPFVLEDESLFYFSLFRLTDNDNGYLARFHHIISDGWSTSLVTEQICTNYLKLLREEKIDNNPEHSYIEYIENERNYLLSDKFIKNKAYWNEKFRVIPQTALNKSSDIITGNRKTFELDFGLSSMIKEFVLNNKCSLNSFFISLYLLYINKTTEQDDIVIGTPVLNRSGTKEKSTFGMFTSTMAFRFFLDENEIFPEIMKKVNEELKRCYFNQRYPYDLLIKDLELKKKGYDNLFNICVNYYNTRHASDINGLHMETVEFYNGNQIYSMQLVIKDWSSSGRLLLEFDYKVNDYSSEQIKNMFDNLINLINQITGNPNTKIKKMSLLSEDDRKKLLYEFNLTEAEYPKYKTIYHIFEEQVNRTPDNVALIFNNNILTYRELNEKSNRLAGYLHHRGVKAGSIIGLLTTHSFETVIGILGVLKAGGAYVPIDANYPHDRINYMLEDSRATILLTNFELPHNIYFNGAVLNLNNQNFYPVEISKIEPAVRPHDLAYIIYTSGSTGKPKGAMIEHQGLVNYIWWAKKMYVKDEDEAFALYSSLAFDLTVTSIFTPLISGSKIFIYSQNDDEYQYVIYRIMKENKSTIVKLTPSHLILIKDLDNKDSSVRRFIVGGEDLNTSVAKEVLESFGGNIEIFNEYGPTETVVGCMIHKYDIDKDMRLSVPIGVPADNVQIYILDKNLNPVPINTVGEIFISGDGVAKGYLNRDALTREKFLKNPFIEGKRMYRTGDLARFIDDGKIEYIGRKDQQVKIRGYRIEPGEIEKYLVNHEAVKDAAVIKLEDKNKSSYLCAYIVKKFDVSTNQLKEFLQMYLPDYMVPSYFVELDEIPLTANGKVNRQLLPERERETLEDTEFVMYRNEKEEKLVTVLCEVLNVERASMRQSFYSLGGDSIKAIQIASKLYDMGFKITVKEILSYPILEEMVLRIDNNKKCVINQEICRGGIKPTPIVSWFFSKDFANENYYNQSVLLELKQVIEAEKLEIIMNELIKHHDSLRINYNSKTNQLFYNDEHLDKYHKIPEYDLSNLPFSRQADEMKHAVEKLKMGVNLKDSLLIKACIFKLGVTRRLFITAHHLVVDGVSWRIILDDINTMINQINNKQEIILSSKTHSYQSWAELLENYGNKDLNSEKKYWDYVLSTDFKFPSDYDLGLDTIDKSNTISFQLSEEETESLLLKSNSSYNTEPKDLLITALVVTIKKFTGKEGIVIELEGHGREDVFEGIDITRTVGWFTSMYPFYIKLESDDLSSQIKAVKEELRKIPNNGIGFGILKYVKQVLHDNNQRNIRFNYLGDFTLGYNSKTISLMTEQLSCDSSKENCLTCIMDINCYLESNKLSTLLTYSTNKFTANTIDVFVKTYIDTIKNIINHCSNKEEAEFTPSDFDATDISQEELDKLFSN